MRLSLLNPIDSRLAPPPDRGRVAFLRHQPYAHRGLHGEAILENSHAAFDAAIKCGHGIECDVQAAADGTAFVFHDYELDRLSEASGTFAKRSSVDLDLIPLKNGHGKIPRLRETLDHIDGRAPVLIEIKSRNAEHAPLCLSVRRALEGYRGKAAIMSFNPLVSAWFAKRAPHIVRGLVITEEHDAGWLGDIKRHRNLWIAKPDFLAYDIRDLPSRFGSAQRKRGLPLLTWTVRTAAQESVALSEADEIIYEMPVVSLSDD